MVAFTACAAFWGEGTGQGLGARCCRKQDVIPKNPVSAIPNQDVWSDKHLATVVSDKREYRTYCLSGENIRMLTRHSIMVEVI